MEVYALDASRQEQLTAAFLVYGSFATVHQVEQRKGGTAILPGTLASKSGLLTALRALLPKEEATSGLIPETLLAKEIGYMAWWVKPGPRTVFFKCDELGGERSATVDLPGLVMMTGVDGWYVFAVKGKQRPTPNTPLYVSPFWNVWAQGKICTGTAKLPEAGLRDKPEAWERAFFESYFTHPNIREVGKLVKGSSYAFWQQMLDGKFPKFPMAMLVKSAETLEMAHRRIARGDN